MITRKFGKIFRGKATPAQLLMAALIGTTAGFMPGFAQAPGLLAVLFLAALILNANLALLGLCLLAGKVLSLVLLPVSFAVGQLLLDGPLQGVFAFLVNAPVLALFGFEYYATTGGLVLGLLTGAVFGFGTVLAVQSFRRKMAQLEKGSEKWANFSARPWVKAFTFVFIGGSRGKLSYEELMTRKGGSPIRPLGLAAAGLAIVCGFFVTLLASDDIVKYLAQTGLEEANGATVDLEKAELRLRDGRVILAGVAMADPKALETDLFRAETIEADIHQADLLRKRVHIENLRVSSASSGETRSRRGILIRPLPEVPPEPKAGEAKTFEDYVREAEKWKQRLSQVADWVDRISGPSAEEVEEELESDRTIRKGREAYRRAVARHLVEGSPTLLISHAAVEKMRVAHFPDETLDIVAENFSTHPNLVDNPPRFSIRSSGQTFIATGSMAGLSRQAGVNTLEFAYLNLPVDRVAEGLRFASEKPLQGGNIDVRGSGSWSSREVDLPLEVTLRGSRLSLAQVGETQVENLVLPIGVAGPIRNPRIHFTDTALADALTAAGKAELARRLQGETDKLRNQAEERVGGELRERSRGLLEGRLPLPGSRERQ